MELFRQRTGVDITHIPYAGGGAAVTDLISGTLQLSLLNIATVAPHVQAGRLRAIAVGGRARHPLLPEVPTIMESGIPDFQSGSWHSIAAPKGMPDALADRIHGTVTTALRAPEVGARFATIGFQVEASGRAEMAAQVRRELDAWRGVVRAANIAAG
jgi:tripartite-type tricarboxylate transporter receptor subunit TctC